MTAKTKTTRGRGRPTKYTEATIKTVFDALRRGNTRRAACAAAGISQETLCQWVNEFPEFSEGCTRAENNAEMGYTDIIQRCAVEGDWKAAAWWLERRRKEDFSSRQEVSGPNGGAIQLEAVIDAGINKIYGDDSAEN